MEFHRLFKYGVPEADISYGSSLTSSPAYSEWFTGDVKLDLGNSLNSPLSGQMDSDTLSVLSDGQDENSSMKIRLGISPHNSSVINLQEAFQLHSPDNERHLLQKIERNFMAPNTDEATTSTPIETKPSETLKPQSRSWTGKSQKVTGKLQKVTGKLQKVTGKTQKESTKLIAESQKLTGESLKLSGESQKVTGVIQSEQPQREGKKGIPRGDVKQLLIECAKAISEDKLDDFEMLVQETRKVVSISGEPIERLGAYMVEGLVARQEASGTNIYHSLRCREPSPESQDLMSYMQILYDICPYLKFGYMAANGAIAEAVRNEDQVHIIDFQIGQGTQWVTLIQALAAKPGGPLHLRITGIDDPVSNYAWGDGLHAVGKRLSAISKKFKIPFEFHPMPVYVTEVTREMLDVRPGEALAVNFPFQLHHTPDESVDVNNPRDGLLRMVKGLSPKVTTLVEQESNTNTTPFLTRFRETLDYYSAMFESIDVTLRRDSRERINVEQHCLAKEIVNVIACEGKERIERHELLGKWRSRLSMAGFQAYPLSSYMNSVIRSLLRSYSGDHTLVEKDGAMLLGWKERNLISASAWH